MQFPVPQFTDVEDRIIGPLTIMQFGIVFGAGIIIFLGYSATKSILVLVFLCILFGIPALAFAFVPFNGRPIYKNMGPMLRFFSQPKLMIFHKEVQGKSVPVKLKDAELSTEAKEEKPTHKATFSEVQKLLSETDQKERDMIRKM